MLLGALWSLRASAVELPRRAAVLRLSDGTKILSMAVQDDTVLLGLQANAGDELVVVDASNPLDPHVAWGYELGADLNGMDVAGGRAFLATAVGDSELIVLDLATRAPLATFDAPTAGLVVHVVSPDPALWLGIENDPAGREAFLIDMSDLAAPMLLGSREAIGNLRNPAPPSPVEKGYLPLGEVVARGRGRVRPDLTFLAVNGPSAELQVVSGLDDEVSIADTNGDGIRRLACLGDSNTFELLDKNPGSWCHYLQQTVWSSTTQVLNIGFLGATMTPAPTAEAFGQLSSAIDRGVDMAIAAFGTNDVLTFAPSEIVDAARTLADTAVAAGIPMLLATPVVRYDVPGTDVLQKITDTSVLLRAAFPPDRILDFNAIVGEDDIGPDDTHVGVTGVLKTGRLARERVVVPAPDVFSNPCTSWESARRSRLKLSKVDTPAGDEQLSFRGVVSLSNAGPIDPVTMGSHVMLFGASGAILLERSIPSGAYRKADGAGWRVNRARTSFRYETKKGTAGITHVSITASRATAGSYDIRVIAKRLDVPVIPADLPITGSLLLVPERGECAAVAFPAGGGPSCRIGHRALSCK